MSISTKDGRYIISCLVWTESESKRVYERQLRLLIDGIVAAGGTIYCTPDDEFVLIPGSENLWPWSGHPGPYTVVVTCMINGMPIVITKRNGFKSGTIGLSLFVNYTDETVLLDLLTYLDDKGVFPFKKVRESLFKDKFVIHREKVDEGARMSYATQTSYAAGLVAIADILDDITSCRTST